MATVREDLAEKAKLIVSYICGIMFWTIELNFPMSSPKQYPAYQTLPDEGLKTLHENHKQNNNSTIIHSHERILLSPLPPSLSPSPSPSPSPWSSSSSSFESLFSSSAISYSTGSSWKSSLVGDVIGTESGVHTTADFDLLTRDCEKTRSIAKRNSRCIERRGEYPPPIPSLARTEYTRHYKDGKLILTEEPVEHHQYFEAQRGNGRLILKLVPTDDNRFCHPLPEEEDKKEEVRQEGLLSMEEDNESVHGETINIEDDAEASKEEDNGEQVEVEENLFLMDEDNNADDQQVKSTKCNNDDDECDNYDEKDFSDDEVDDIEAAMHKRSLNAMLASSLSKSFCDTGKDQGVGEHLRKCLTYAGTDLSFFDMAMLLNRPVRT